MQISPTTTTIRLTEAEIRLAIYNYIALRLKGNWRETSLIFGSNPETQELTAEIVSPLPVRTYEPVEYPTIPEVPCWSRD